MNTKTYELSTGMELLDKPESLEVLARRIKIQIHELFEAAGTATAAALFAGRMLTEAKAQVKHGEWNNWILQNCNLAPRTARAYMQLSKNWPKIDESNRHHVADLPLRDAFKAIAAEHAPQPKRPGIKATKRTDAERAVAIFSKAEMALKKSRKLIALHFVVKSDQVTGLRKNLNAVLAELDALEVTVASEGGAA